MNDNLNFVSIRIGPPGAPVITEVGGDFVHLEWTKPEDGKFQFQAVQIPNTAN